MARTDDDSWDITEGVGATALGVAWARSQEATSKCPLYTDPYAEVFLDARMGGVDDRRRGSDEEIQPYDR